MDITRVQDIHPLLRDIVDSFSRFDFPGSGKAKIMAWVVRLSELSATEALNVEDKTQVGHKERAGEEDQPEEEEMVVDACCAPPLWVGRRGLWPSIAAITAANSRAVLLPICRHALPLW